MGNSIGEKNITTNQDTWHHARRRNAHYSSKTDSPQILIPDFICDILGFTYFVAMWCSLLWGDDREPRIQPLT